MSTTQTQKQDPAPLAGAGQVVPLNPTPPSPAPVVPPAAVVPPAPVPSPPPVAAPAPIPAPAPIAGPAPISAPAPVAAPAVVPAAAPAATPLRAPTPVAPAPSPAAEPLPPTARPSYMRRRHAGLILSFFLAVVAPISAVAAYLWLIAEDQYASYLGFSVHREDMSPGLSLLSGLSSISGSSSAETDILYDFIFSQQLVASVDAEIDLRKMWSKADYDPIFAYKTDGTIEDLMDFWKDMVSVYYDSTTRLIEVRVRAFTPEDAQLIAQTIFDKSTTIINQLNDVATEDALRYAREDLERTETELREIRAAMTAFRRKHQLIDPSADLATQTTVIAALEEQLVSAQVEMDLLAPNAIQDDPRIESLQRRIQVIQDRIAFERDRLAQGAAGPDGGLVGVVAEYEDLAVDREFAEKAYSAARVAYEGAQIEARRQSRYLAAHVLPTLAESSRFPERAKLLSTSAVFVFMLWAIGGLIYYSLRDRR